MNFSLGSVLVHPKKVSARSFVYICDCATKAANPEKNKLQERNRNLLVLHKSHLIMKFRRKQWIPDVFVHAFSIAFNNAVPIHPGGFDSLPGLRLWNPFVCIQRLEINHEGSFQLEHRDQPLFWTDGKRISSFSCETTVLQRVDIQRICDLKTELFSGLWLPHWWRVCARDAFRQCWTSSSWSLHCDVECRASDETAFTEGAKDQRVTGAKEWIDNWSERGEVEAQSPCWWN